VDGGLVARVLSCCPQDEMSLVFRTVVSVLHRLGELTVLPSEHVLELTANDVFRVADTDCSGVWL
jgi:hypothetical protein